MTAALCPGCDRAPAIERDYEWWVGCRECVDVCLIPNCDCECSPVQGCGPTRLAAIEDWNDCVAEVDA